MISSFFPRQFFLFFIILSFSCGRNDRVDTKAVKEAIRNREIRKISDAQILEKGLEMGKKDSQKFVACHNELLGQKTDYKNCFNKVELENIKDLMLYNISSPVSNLSPIESEIIEAYKYMHDQGQPLFSNLQDLKNGDMVFSSPVVSKPSSDSLFIKENSVEANEVLFIYYPKKRIVLSIQE